MSRRRWDSRSRCRTSSYLTFAGQTSRSFFLKGGPYQPTLENLPDELELREQTLPPKEDWEKAAARAGALFGLTVAQTLNAGNVAKLAEGVLAKAKEGKDPVGSLTHTLEQKIAAYLPSGADAPRLKTARSAHRLLADLGAADASRVVQVLAQASIETSEAAMAQTLAKARVLDEAVRTAGWQVLEAVTSLADHRAPAAQAIKTRIAEILAADEHAIALKPALDAEQAKALKLLTDTQRPRPEAEPPGPGPGTVVVREAAAMDLDPTQAQKLLAEIRQQLDQDADLRLSISWKLVKKTGR